MHVSARADYALRAVAELAVSPADGRVKRHVIATRQRIPVEFLESVLLALKHAGIVQSKRGAGGGFRLALPPGEISLADVIRAVDGPMTEVRGDRPETTEYVGAAAHLQEVWIAVRASLREVLEGISVDDLVSGTLPQSVLRLTRDPEAWVSLAGIHGAEGRRSAQRTDRPTRRPASVRLGQAAALPDVPLEGSEQ